MHAELWFLAFIRATYPIAFISLILIWTGYLKGYIVGAAISKRNRMIIETLERKLGIHVEKRGLFK